MALGHLGDQGGGWAGLLHSRTVSTGPFVTRGCACSSGDTGSRYGLCLGPGPRLTHAIIGSFFKGTCSQTLHEEELTEPCLNRWPGRDLTSSFSPGSGPPTPAVGGAGGSLMEGRGGVGVVPTPPYSLANQNGAHLQQTPWPHVTPCLAPDPHSPPRLPASLPRSPSSPSSESWGQEKRQGSLVAPMLRS